MKKVFLGTLILSALAFTACNDNSKGKEADTMSTMGKDSAKQAAAAADTSVAMVTPSFANVDAKVSAYMATLVGDYLRLKNALANDNSSGAADAGKAMAETMDKADKSLFSPEQKKLYDANEDDLKEHAEHIGKNGGNIKHQREHFSMMSEDVYALVKGYGGGQALYHDYCPMYDNNKGAMWLSEVPGIKNPYLGKAMPECGQVKEKIN